MMDIQQACQAFEQLLLEQQARIEGMDGTKTDFATKAQVTIGIVDGDGIGPIITSQATRVLEKLLAPQIQSGAVKISMIQGLTIENRLAKNKPIPDDVMAALLQCDVILKGPTTTPQIGRAHV